MLDNIKRNKIIAASVVMALCLCSCFVAFNGDDSDAASDATYGTISEFNLAPGFRWTYTPTYPSDLSVTTSILKQGTNTSSGTSSNITSGSWASISGSTVTVTVPTNASVGTVYDIILKAITSTGGVSQTAYQYIRANITSGLTATGTASDVILGNSTTVSLSTSSSMGSVTWSVTSGKTMPAGSTLSGSTVTGTPTKMGSNTIYLTASAKGQTVNVIIPFMVYNVIKIGSAETIKSFGTAVSSTAIAQTGNDLGVTWSVTSGSLPSGFTLNSSTGIVSGSSTVKQSSVVTITGTSHSGPSQTATKQITIQSEPKMTSITGDNTILTYSGNGNVTKTYASSAQVRRHSPGHSSELPQEFPSIIKGKVTVTGSAAVTAGVDFTVKADIVVRPEHHQERQTHRRRRSRSKRSKQREHNGRNGEDLIVFNNGRKQQHVLPCRQ